MIIDGLFIFHLKDELNKNLKNSRLERITQINEELFLFAFYYQKVRYFLHLNLNAQEFGCFLSGNNNTTKIQTQFYNNLKKHLETAILKEIVQYKTDRVLIFVFTKYDFIEGPIEIKLIFEMMGRYSNLLLVKNEILLDSYKKMFFESGRQLLPGATFEFFPQDKKEFTLMTYDDLKDPKYIMDTFMGISPSLAKYLYDNKKLPLELKINPTISLTVKRSYFTNIFSPNDEVKFENNLSILFTKRFKKDVKKTSSHEIFILKQINKMKKRLEELKLLLEREHDNLQFKDDADAIYSSLIDLKETRSHIEFNGKTISLDPTKTLNENAQILYDKYHKAKRGVSIREKLILEQQANLNHLKELHTYYKISRDAELLDLEAELALYGYKEQKRKKKSNLPNITKIDIFDSNFYIGKNSKQNTYLISEIAHKNDFWFHVKDAPGAHIVVKTNNLNEDVIRMAAKLAALYSDLSESSSIPVDYTEIKYLRKIPRRPGFNVTYKNFKTIFIDLDEEFIEQYHIGK